MRSDDRDDGVMEVMRVRGVVMGRWGDGGEACKG